MEKKKIVGYEIHTLDNMLGKTVSYLMEKEGITKMQSWIIRYLYEHRSMDVFQKDLEAFFHIARSTATGILQCMEKHDLLYREPVPYDARLKRLVLTEKGIQQQLFIQQTMLNLENVVKANISSEKMETFFEVILTMKNNIKTIPDFSNIPQDSCNPSCPDETDNQKGVHLCSKHYLPR